MPGLDVSCAITSIGDPTQALEAAGRAAREVPAYGRFLADNKIEPGLISRRGAPWAALPVMDKKNYCLRYPYQDLMPAEHREEAWTLSTSSGTSGSPCYWPSMPPGYFARQSKSALLRRLAGRRRWEPAVDDSARLHRYFPLTRAMAGRRTLVVVGRAMGSWRGGSRMYAQLSMQALRQPGMTVLPVGNRVDEIANAILALHEPYERVWTTIVPSLLEQLLDRASREPGFPFAKCHFNVGGESFPEALRLRASQLCGKRFPDDAVDSAFGSADTGLVGYESPASIGLRQLLESCPELRQALGLPSPVPNLFHAWMTTYLECLDGELIFTKWRGIPLIRYNLHDRGMLLSWERLRETAAAARVPDELEPILKHILDSPSLPDLFSVQGRTDGVKLKGGTLFYDDLNAALRHPLLLRSATGEFKVRLRRDASPDPQLIWDIELKAGLEPSAELERSFRGVLVEEMCRLDAQFASDYARTYGRRDSDPKTRVFAVNFQPWPALTDELAKHPKRRFA